MFARDLYKFCPACGSGRFHTHHKNSKECHACGLEVYQNPAATASALIFNTHGELLIARRALDPGIGMLDLPGGFIEPGETLETALSRELLEETGVELTNFTYFASFPNDYFYKGLTVHTLDFFFTIQLTDPVNFTPSDDVAELFFTDPRSIDLNAVAFESIQCVIQKIC